MTNTQVEIEKECARQEANAQDTATPLFLWLRDVRRLKRVYLLGQLLAGAGAAWGALNGEPIWAGVFGVVAGVAPSVWDALKLDAHEETIRYHAAEFTRLRDRFRQARKIESTRGLEHLERAFSVLMDEMDAARKASLTPSEHYFTLAQSKIGKGDYKYSVDQEP